MYIEVYGNKPTLPGLRAWLERAVRIVVNAPQHGLEPNGAVGIMIADFEQMKSA